MKDEKENGNKNTGNKVRNILLVIFLFLLLLLISIQFKQDFLNYFTSKESSNSLNSKEQPGAASGSVSEEAYSVGPEPPLLSFGSEENEDDSEHDLDNPYEEKSEELSAYVNITSNSGDTDINKGKFFNSLEHYRIFLKNANKMIEKSMMGKSYDDELVILNSIDYPDKIKEILSSFENYNQLLKNSNDNYSNIKINPLGLSFVEKFIKITKISDDRSKELLKIQEEVFSNITVFSDYVYSSDLQNKFFTK